MHLICVVSHQRLMSNFSQTTVILKDDKVLTLYFYPNVWADQRIQQEFKSVIAGWITSYPTLPHGG